ncbi:MAG: ABC transporter substrate-binding protein [Fastidiosipilaceae bacterium]
MQTKSDAKGKKITVTDVAGREVQVKVPAEKVVVQYTGSGGAFLTMLALEGKDVAQKVAGWDNGLENYRNDMYKQFVEAVPDLANIPDIGSIDNKTLNIEKIISLKPDVVFMPMNALDTIKDDINRFETAGIPTVVIDFHKETLENHTKSILLIGKIIGKEQRAKELSDYYTDQVNKVYSRVAALNKPKPTVYVECAQDPSTYGNSYASDCMWGAFVAKCGGKNIAEGKVTKASPLNPEYVIKSNPDVIILTGSYWPKNPDSMKLGYTATADDSRRLLVGFTKRQGWDALKAVRNNQVYSVNHGIARDIWDFVPIQYFAKCLYPNEFKDLDPEASMKEFHQKFLPVEFGGVWTLDIKN